MNKERLKEVKNKSSGIYSFEEEDIVGVDVKVDDYKWLIEQAERVHELEDELIVQKEYFEELQNNHIRVCNQNKRYRELIKKLKRMVYDPDVDCGMICTEIIEMEESE